MATNPGSSTTQSMSTKTIYHPPSLVEQEFRSWQNHWMELDEDRPDTLARTIRMCNPDNYPNIFVLLQIACTLGVTSCECERSISALRRLRTYLRASMGESRLSALAHLHIHYNSDINPDEIVDKFCRNNVRQCDACNYRILFLRACAYLKYTLYCFGEH